jgi:hypothetical protein
VHRERPAPAKNDDLVISLHFRPPELPLLRLGGPPKYNTRSEVSESELTILSTPLNKGS